MEVEKNPTLYLAMIEMKRRQMEKMPPTGNVNDQGLFVGHGEFPFNLRTIHELDLHRNDVIWPQTIRRHGDILLEVIIYNPHDEPLEVTLLHRDEIIEKRECSSSRYEKITFKSGYNLLRHNLSIDLKIDVRPKKKDDERAKLFDQAHIFLIYGILEDDVRRSLAKSESSPSFYCEMEDGRKY